LIQYLQQQVVTALKYLHGHCLHAGYCQSFIQGNSSAVMCWKHWLPLLTILLHTSAVRTTKLPIVVVKWCLHQGTKSYPFVVHIAIAFPEIYWLVLTYNHEQLQWKPPWVFLMCISINGCYSSSSHNKRIPGVVNWFWRPQDTKLEISDLLYRTLKDQPVLSMNLSQHSLESRFAIQFGKSLSLLLSYSSSQFMRRFLCCVISKKCWKHWLKLLESAVQANGFNKKLAVSGVHWQSVDISAEYLQYQLESHETLQVGGIKWKDTLLSQLYVDTRVHLQKTSEHFSIFPDITNLVVLQSCFVQCCWIQWKIHWPLFTMVCWFGKYYGLLSETSPDHFLSKNLHTPVKIYDGIFELVMLLSMHCNNSTGSSIYCHWMVLVLIHVLLHLTCCMVDHYWAACRARKLAFVWALLGSIKTNFNRNAVDFKLVEMVTDPGVHVLRGGQASLHFVLPSEELR